MIINISDSDDEPVVVPLTKRPRVRQTESPARRVPIKKDQATQTDGLPTPVVAAPDPPPPSRRPPNANTRAARVDLLNADASALVEHLRATPEANAQRLNIVSRIQQAIASKWPGAQVELFGSVATGAYLPDSDVDLVVLSPSMPQPPHKAPFYLLNSILGTLVSAGITSQDEHCRIVAQARVPIIKCKTVPALGSLAIDINVNNQKGVAALATIRGLLDRHSFSTPSGGSGGGGGGGGGSVPSDDGAQARLNGVGRSLVLLVKSFLKERQMNEVYQGGLGSYALICMVISFLQHNAKLRAQIWPEPASHLGELFHEFLTLYGKKFNYYYDGISVRADGSYFNKQERRWFQYNEPYALSIEDPGDTCESRGRAPHRCCGVLNMPEDPQRTMSRAGRGTSTTSRQPSAWPLMPWTTRSRAVSCALRLLTRTNGLHPPRLPQPHRPPLPALLTTLCLARFCALLSRSHLRWRSASAPFNDTHPLFSSSKLYLLKCPLQPGPFQIREALRRPARPRA